MLHTSHSLTNLPKIYTSEFTSKGFYSKKHLISKTFAASSVSSCPYKRSFVSGPLPAWEITSVLTHNVTFFQAFCKSRHRFFPPKKQWTCHFVISLFMLALRRLRSDTSSPWPFFPPTRQTKIICLDVRKQTATLSSSFTPRQNYTSLLNVRDPGCLPLGPFCLIFRQR